MNKHDAVISAVEYLKACQFKATAIKVELEAQLNRGDGDCDHTCSECYGDYESVEQTCNGCDGSNTRGDDDTFDDNRDCEECSGFGRVNYCQYCDEGRADCDGDCSDSWGTAECQSYIMERLAALGLADNQQPCGALKYARFYRDGSVDSEFTFTLSLDNPENVFLLPKIIDIWNQLAEEIGNEVDVTGAGMHMALINSRSCSYPIVSRQHQFERFVNFKRSMKLLLPALYFLGTSNDQSRGLGYRRPDIGHDSHRAAIDYRGGAVEFRIFDTCYDQPEHILDNLVVMRNCMRYWTKRYKAPKLDKITKSITFGHSGNQLERFYVTATHVELLNAGLKKLKPSYYTIKEIKRQRNFRVNKHSLKAKLNEYKQGLAKEYEEYTERYEWNILARKHSYMSELISQTTARKPDRDSELAKIEQRAEELVKETSAAQQKLDDFITSKLTYFNDSLRGEYTLNAE